MGKGAVDYIVAIVLGVAVIALLGYWFFTSQRDGSGSANLAECTAVKTQFCAIQTEENWNKMLTKCGDANKFKSVEVIETTSGINFKKIDNQCNSFCSTVIPGWSPLSSNNHPECSKPPQPTKA